MSCDAIAISARFQQGCWLPGQKPRGPVCCLGGSSEWTLHSAGCFYAEAAHPHPSPMAVALSAPFQSCEGFLEPTVCLCLHWVAPCLGPVQVGPQALFTGGWEGWGLTSPACWVCGMLRKPEQCSCKCRHEGGCCELLVLGVCSGAACLGPGRVGQVTGFSLACLFARGFEQLDDSDMEHSNYVFPLTLKLI